MKDEIAHAIVRYIPVGIFSASDAESVVRQHVRTHPLIPAYQARFTQFLLNEVASTQEELGVLLDRKKKSPKRYTITEESKRLI